MDGNKLDMDSELLKRLQEVTVVESDAKVLKCNFWKHVAELVESGVFKQYWLDGYNPEKHVSDAELVHETNHDDLHDTLIKLVGSEPRIAQFLADKLIEAVNNVNTHHSTKLSERLNSHSINTTNLKNKWNISSLIDSIHSMLSEASGMDFHTMKSGAFRRLDTIEQWHLNINISLEALKNAWVDVLPTRMINSEKQSFVSSQEAYMRLRDHIKDIEAQARRSTERLRSVTPWHLVELSKEFGHEIWIHTFMEQWKDYIDELANSLKKAEWRDVISYVLDKTDDVTHRHSIKVSLLVSHLVRHLKFDEVAKTWITIWAIGHDIWKFLVPRSIIEKKWTLTPEEREMIDLHPLYWFNMLKPKNFSPIIISPFDYMSISALMALYHHIALDCGKWKRIEMFTRYQDDISLLTFPHPNVIKWVWLLQVVDNLVALVEKRSYKPALPLIQALFLLKENYSQWAFFYPAWKCLMNVLTRTAPIIREWQSFDLPLEKVKTLGLPVEEWYRIWGERTYRATVTRAVSNFEAEVKIVNPDWDVCHKPTLLNFENNIAIQLNTPYASSKR